LKLSCSCHMTACHHHDGEAVVASRPRGWTQARCKAAWTRAEEEKPESSPLWTRPRCPLRPRALLRRRCPPSPPTSRRTRPARAPQTPPRPPLPRGVSSPRGDSTRKLRSTYVLGRRVTEGMISGGRRPQPVELRRGGRRRSLPSSTRCSSSSLLQAVWFQARVEKKEGGRGIDGHFPSGADSDPRWSDDLACHVSKSGKNIKILSFMC